MALPLAVALQAVDAPFNYLGFVNDSPYKGCLAFSTEEVLSPYAKFAVENAGNGLVHLRSCYNNKYWVRSSDIDYWIVAASDKPEEDQSAWNCTLFKPNLTDGGKKVTFVHAQLGTTVGTPNNDPSRKAFLCLKPLATNEAVSTVIDYGSLVKLPKYIAFKSNNGLYFTNKNSSGQYTSFESTDLADPYIVCEVAPGKDGNVQIKAKELTRYGEEYFWKQFWPEEDYSGYIGITIDIPDDLTEWFSLIVVDKDVIALRNLRNNKFCRRMDLKYLNEHPIKDALSASASSIIEEARLQVVEPVLKRTVDVLQYDLDNVRIYNESALALASQTVTNNTNVEQESALQFIYTDTRTYSWNNGLSVSTGVNTTFTAGIPEIASSSVQITAEFSDQYQWGETVDKSQQVGVTPTVKVPPMTRMKATLVATIGSCDIPFAYVQVDQFANGDRITTTTSDGIYKGVNLYNFDVTYDQIERL